MALPDPVRVRIAHVTDGRARLRLAGSLDRAALGDLADALAGLPRVRRVLARPNTGSLIVEADATADALRAALDGCEAIRILPPEPPIQVDRAAQAGLMKLDLAIRGRTENALDVRSAIAVLLIGGAAVQLLRGRIAGPATTLFLAGLSYLEPKR